MPILSVPSPKRACGLFLSLFPRLLVSILPTMTIAPAAFADPDPLFKPVLPQILEQAPPATTVRLPPHWFSEVSPSTVQVFSSRTLSLLTVGLSTCQTGVLPCLVGTLTIEPTATANGQRSYQQHQAGFAPITLGKNLKGYFLDGNLQRPKVSFSSVMWQQNNTFYTLTFPNNDRQNGLFTARDMVNSDPLKQ